MGITAKTLNFAHVIMTNDMLTYNTKLKKLILPEYGRNIQKMVEHCLTIADRDERTRCAFAIVDTMENIFPPEGDPEEYRRKLWDHLAIMSEFALDIDWPYEIIKPDSLDTKPEPISNITAEVTYRHYGKNLEAMIDVATQMPEGEERDALVLLLASHMKKTMLQVNPEGVEDERVFKDLRIMSHGAFNLDPEQVQLPEFKAAPAPSKKKKKK